MTLRRAAEVVVYSNAIVVAAAASLTMATSVFFGFSIAWPVVLLASAATFLVYTLDRLLPLSPEDRVNVPARVAFVERHRAALMIASVCAAAVCAACASQLSSRALAVGLVLGALTLGYAAPVLPHGKRLKDVAGLKPLLIALCWSAGSVLVPLLHAGLPIDARAAGLVVFRMLFIGAAALAFDLRDVHGDGASSLVARIGPAHALRVCRAGLVGAFALACLAVATGIAHAVALTSVVVILVLWLAFARRERLRDDVFLGVVVDGALVLPGVVALAMKGAGLTPVW